MVGIKESKEFLCFILATCEAIDLSLEDGEIGFGDISNLVDAMMKAGAAFGDISKIPAELQDLTAEEMQELCRFVEEEFDLRSDSLEQVIEKAFQVGMELYKLILMVRDVLAENTPEPQA